MLTDTHIHLYNKEFDEDREACLDEAVSAGVSRFFLPNIDLESVGPMLALAEKHPERCFPMMGLHPCYVQQDWEEVIIQMEAEWERRDFCAVGEIGIDLYWDKTFFSQQQEALARQIQWANDRHKPIVIHCRESFREIMEVLDRTPKTSPCGVFHCFTGNPQQAQEVIDRGFYVGIGGVLTFKKSGLDEVVRDIPLDHILLETDAPYLAPVPHRGKRNKPSYVRLVAERLAELKNIPLEEVAAITTANSKKLFGC